MTPSDRARRINRQGQVESHSDARARISNAGDIVFIHRGVLRSALIFCPDGCGEIITVNLDPRVGPAWHLYDDRRGITLFPSVWRETGCRSHFILWNDVIHWCDADDEWLPYTPNGELEERVLRTLRHDILTPYADIAAKLQEIPWEVLSVCERLVATGRARRGSGRTLQAFAKSTSI